MELLSRSIPNQTAFRTGWFLNQPPGRSLCPRIRAALKERQLPPAKCHVIPQDVRVTGRRSDLEVPMLGRKPRIEHLVHFDESVAQPEAKRRLLATVAGVALDGDRKPLITHAPITVAAS